MLGITLVGEDTPYLRKASLFLITALVLVLLKITLSSFSVGILLVL